MIEPVTYIYKTAEKCDLRVNVYQAESDRLTPVIVVLHGGGLIAGNRKHINMNHVYEYLAAGITVVSPDYRLAPETKAIKIVQDIVDAHKWIREKGPSLFNIDPDRLATSGYSAGGYLTLMAGARVNPKPRALVSYYGYGDASGDWYSKPSPYYLQTPIITKEQAYAGIKEVATCDGTSHGRGDFYLYCRQQGIWPQEVCGYDPITEPRKFDAVSPVRLVTKDYPPTMLLHGMVDNDVPYQQSEDIAKELEKAGVEHELILLENKDHGFDYDISNPEIQAVFNQAFEFLKRRLGVGEIGR